MSHVLVKNTPPDWCAHRPNGAQVAYLVIDENGAVTEARSVAGPEVGRADYLKALRM